ncbi:MAG: hypothetical protein RLO21_15995 [Nitratireductor sp.]
MNSMPFRSTLTGIKANEAFALETDPADMHHHGSACLGRHNHPSNTSTFEEFVRACFILGRQPGGWNCGQPLWFCVRQVMELGLKHILNLPDHEWKKFSHRLGDLLKAIDDRGISFPNIELRQFIQRLEQFDAPATGGRYPFVDGNTPSLNEVCCMDQEKTLFFVDQMRAMVIDDQKW